MKKLTIAAVIAFVVSTSAFALTKPKYIGMAKARAIASAHVHGKIQSSELEREHGRMIYSFDIRGADKRIHEININAITGAIVVNKVESPAAEAKEKKADKAKH